MNWKTSYSSLYYEGAPEPDDPVLPPEETALLVIDVQNTYLERPDVPRCQKTSSGVTMPGHRSTSRMHKTVIRAWWNF